MKIKINLIMTAVFSLTVGLASTAQAKTVMSPDSHCMAQGLFGNNAKISIRTTEAMEKDEIMFSLKKSGSDDVSLLHSYEVTDDNILHYNIRLNGGHHGYDFESGDTVVIKTASGTFRLLCN